MSKHFTPETVRRRIRHHAVLGVDSCERFPANEAVEMALLEFQSILNFLDRLDDAERTARICRIVGVKVGIDGEPLIQNSNL